MSITEKRVWQLRRLPGCSHVPGPTLKLTFLRSSMSQIPERSDGGDRCSGWGHFWGVIWGSRCLKNINFPPQQLQSRNKLTFPFKSRTNTADADILVGKYPGEKSRAVSKSTLEYGSVEGRTLGSHHLASSSPPLSPLTTTVRCLPGCSTKLARRRQTTSGESSLPFDVQQEAWLTLKS